MCSVSVTDFRKNLFHYIELCAAEDIQITNSGKIVAVLSSPDKQFYQSLFDLCGCLKEFDTGEDYTKNVGEGILQKCGF